MRLATRHSRNQKENRTYDVPLEEAWSMDSAAGRAQPESNRGRKLEGNMTLEENFSQRMSNTQVATIA